MLKIFYNLSPFFEDCYRRISVREYARMSKISPPTASKLLEDYNKEGLLQKENYRNYIFFYANNENKLFIELSRIYWKNKLIDLISYLEEKLVEPTIILFGSVSKAEISNQSDIDIAIFCDKKELNFEKFEKTYKKKIQIFWFSSIKDIKNQNLATNIINGYVLRGRLRLK